MNLRSVSPSAQVAEGAMHRVAFRDLAVDLFGGLVPGMVFILTSAAVLGWSLTAVLLTFTLGLNPGRYGSIGVVGAVDLTRRLVDPFSLEVFVFILLLSYVVGHTFFRQDPKEADRRSFERLYPHKRQETARWSWMRPLHPERWRVPGLRRIVVREPARHASEEGRRKADDELRRWVARDCQGCEFPYDHLHAYLSHRGLDHLARMVSWGREGAEGDAEKRRVRRSKTFINILKIRLNFYFPEQCGAISRNEAHVRLMSSSWYMVRKLRIPAGAALSVSLFAIAVGLANGFARSSPALLGFAVGSGLFAAGVLMAARLGRGSIEKFLHYQRVREVVWVLETAYTAFRDRPELLADICPDFAAAPHSDAAASDPPTAAPAPEAPSEDTARDEAPRVAVPKLVGAEAGQPPGPPPAVDPDG